MQYKYLITIIVRISLRSMTPRNIQLKISQSSTQLKRESEKRAIFCCANGETCIVTAKTYM